MPEKHPDRDVAGVDAGDAGVGGVGAAGAGGAAVAVVRDVAGAVDWPTAVGSLKYRFVWFRGLAPRWPKVCSAR